MTSLSLVHPIYFPFVLILLATMGLIDRATRFADRALPSYLISLLCHQMNHAVVATILCTMHIII
jgi:hypothetical protein